MRLHGLPDEIPNFIAKRLLKRRGPVGLICVELVQAFLDLGIASGKAAGHVGPAFREPTRRRAGRILVALNGVFYVPDQIIPLLCDLSLHFRSKARGFLRDL